MEQEQQTEVAAPETEAKPDAAPAEAQAIAQPDAAAEQQGEQAPEVESEEKRQSKWARSPDACTKPCPKFARFLRRCWAWFGDCNGRRPCPTG